VPIIDAVLKTFLSFDLLALPSGVNECFRLALLKTLVQELHPRIFCAVLRFEAAYFEEFLPALLNVLLQLVSKAGHSIHFAIVKQGASSLEPARARYIQCALQRVQFVQG
jgi:hypothetical protein